jgi:hypothetical protein
MTFNNPINNLSYYLKAKIIFMFLMYCVELNVVQQKALLFKALNLFKKTLFIFLPTVQGKDTRLQ